MDNDILHYIDPNDRLFHAKNTSIQSHNQIIALIKENKKEIYDKTYYVFSLLFAVITTLYSQSFGYLSILIISNVCLILLLYPAWKFYVRRRDLAKKKYKIEKNLNEFGIKLN
ncbi:MAG: hypothetical protein Q7S74_01815 [Nanoarchaeota archaeon]|nr:hypothetical protein [Nanoarchaeota archaeon]